MDRFRLNRLYTRQNTPDFLDLPWAADLEEWGKLTERIVEVEKGRSRHTVVFVHYDCVYAVKELPQELAKHEYEILKQIEEMNIPSVKPVGYASLIDLEDGSHKSIVITEYLKASLPYRSIFMRSDLMKFRDQLLDALAVLLVTLHIKKIYWGDCSLSNVLFRRDAGELQAYLVDAETSSIYSTLSDPKRDYDLSLMEENLAGELLDLSQVVKLPDNLDIFGVGSSVRKRYDNLWNVLNSGEIILRSESFKINKKIQEINDLGFSVEEIEIKTKDDTGEKIQFIPKVTDRNYHRDKFHSLTGFYTQENIARKLLNEIYEVRAKLTEEKKRDIPLSNAAFYWSNKRYFPLVEELDLIDDHDNALMTYVEVLDIKNQISNREGREVSTEEALRVYRKENVEKADLNIFKRGFRRYRTMSDAERSLNKRQLSRDWKERVIYQIYPSSFFDTDANGVGDIQGIIEKLDYLTWLGVSAIRVNPIFPSPMDDQGYDVTYFKGVDKLFGNLDDFHQLIHEAHNRDLKVILDLIPSHTSIKHPWFEESRRSKDNPYRDWFIWRPPKKDGRPPTNWLSISGESAWKFDELTEEYYLHSFLNTEPDLNWENPQLREKMLNVLRFWLDKHIDGILLVMLSWIAKDRKFRNDPKNPAYDPVEDSRYNVNIPIYSYDRPELLEYVKEIAKVIDEYEDRILVAELDLFSPIESYLEEYSVAKLINIPLNSRFIDQPWEADSIKDFIDNYENTLGETNWPNYLLNTHDFPRIVDRIGRDQARIAATLLLTLRGIPILYYGEEIGMKNTEVVIEQSLDWGRIHQGNTRNRQRSPMQWNEDKKFAGFSEGAPWLPVTEDVKDINVFRQTYVRDSMLNMYRRLLELRKQFESLRLGKYIPLDTLDNCLLYIREGKYERILIILNFSNTLQFINLTSFNPDILLFTSYMDQQNVFLEKSYEIRPNEGILILLNPGKD